MAMSKCTGILIHCILYVYVISDGTIYGFSCMLFHFAVTLLNTATCPFILKKKRQCLLINHPPQPKRSKVVFTDPCSHASITARTTLQASAGVGFENIWTRLQITGMVHPHWKPRAMEKGFQQDRGVARQIEWVGYQETLLLCSKSGTDNSRANSRATKVLFSEFLYLAQVL